MCLYLFKLVNGVLELLFSQLFRKIKFPCKLKVIIVVVRKFRYEIKRIAILIDPHNRISKYFAKTRRITPSAQNNKIVIRRFTHRILLKIGDVKAVLPDF